VTATEKGQPVEDDTKWTKRRGAFGAKFTCTALSALEAAEPSPCAIGPSYYFFENCTTP